MVAKTAAQTKFHSRVETVTPEIAERWLERNNNNRRLNEPVKDSTVNAYARDMAAGKWHLTGDAIKFDTNGDLLDGQHRLWAGIVADSPFETMVVRNVDPDARIVIDTGKKRTFGQYLQMRQTADPIALAAIVNLCLRWEQGNINPDGSMRGKRLVVSHEDALTWLTENPEVEESVRYARGFQRDVKYGMTAAGAAHYLNALVDGDASDEFWTLAATGAELSPGNPILALRRWAHNAATQKARGSSIASEVGLVYCLKAMNLWRAGKTTRVLHIKSGDDIRTWEIPTIKKGQR